MELTKTHRRVVTTITKIKTADNKAGVMKEIKPWSLFSVVHRSGITRHPKRNKRHPEKGRIQASRRPTDVDLITRVRLHGNKYRGKKKSKRELSDLR
jgi:hypothetical protein